MLSSGCLYGILNGTMAGLGQFVVVTRVLDSEVRWTRCVFRWLGLFKARLFEHSLDVQIWVCTRSIV